MIHKLKFQEGYVYSCVVADPTALTFQKVQIMRATLADVKVLTVGSSQNGILILNMHPVTKLTIQHCIWKEVNNKYFKT